MAQILFFGKLSEMSENQNVDLPDTVTDTEKLLEWLGAEAPQLAEALRGAGISIAVNATMVRGAHPLQNSDEIAIMSPMSGG